MTPIQWAALAATQDAPDGPTPCALCTAPILPGQRRLMLTPSGLLIVCAQHRIR